MDIMADREDVAGVVAQLRRMLEEGTKELARLEKVKAQMALAGHLQTALAAVADHPIVVRLTDEDVKFLRVLLDRMPHGVVKRLVERMAEA